MAYLFREAATLSTVLTIIGSAPVIATIIGFLYFMIMAPEKLQSEDYQIRHEALELIREKGSSTQIKPSSLDAIANPMAKRLEGRTK